MSATETATTPAPALRGLTQNAAARLAGVCHKTIREWLRGVEVNGRVIRLRTERWGAQTLIPRAALGEFRDACTAAAAEPAPAPAKAGKAETPDGQARRGAAAKEAGLKRLGLK